MNKVKVYVIALAAMLLASTAAWAQKGVVAPDKQIGIGVFTEGGFSGAGATLQYAFSPSVQVGATLSAAGESQGDNSSLNMNAGLYGRLLFEGPLNPYVQVSFSNTSTSNSTTVNGTTTKVTSSQNFITGYFGLAYYATRNIGIYSQVGLISIGLDPSVTRYGIASGNVGVEWWFNP